MLKNYATFFSLIEGSLYKYEFQTTAPHKVLVLPECQLPAPITWAQLTVTSLLLYMPWSLCYGRDSVTLCGKNCLEETEKYVYIP